MQLYAAVFCLKVDRYKFRRLADGTGRYCNEGLNSLFTRCSAGFKIRCLVGLASSVPINYQKLPI